MKTLKIAATFCILALLTLAQATAATKETTRGSKTRADEVEARLSSVPRPELPAAAAALLAGSNPHERQAMAVAAVQYVASKRPAGITPVVSSLVNAVPDSAPAVVAAAVRLVPSETPAIRSAATQAAPGLAEEIAQAAGAPTSRPVQTLNSNGNKNDNADKNKGDKGDKGNRPTVPPGLVGTTKPGTIHGNRPTVPPGHVRDPKPGRDPQRRNYGRP